jgi:TolB-like protein/Flp pilus assembly protein TadD
MGKQPRHFYEFGPFRLNASERVLLRDGKPVLLTSKAIETLIVLVQNSGHVVDKEELIKAVWTDSFVEEGSLTRNVSVLRKALGGDIEENEYIETLPRRGYRFRTEVKEVWDDRVDPSVERRAGLQIVKPEEEEPDSLDEPQAKIGRADLEKTSTNKRQSFNAAVRSLAVLPFRLLSSDSSEEYLGLGIADALITRLSNIRQIIVRPTSAVFKYTGSGQDPVVAGRELNVESVLAGSIQSLGDRIRVTVQLVSVEEEATLWAEKFDEKFTDIFAMEDSVSEKVADALTLTLSGEERKLLTKRYTENIEAYQTYLKGRYFWNKRTPEGVRRAFEYFQQVTDIDPTYALAYAGLADYFNVLGIYSGIPPDETFPRAKAAAMMALGLDDTLAEAHTSLALVRLFYDWNYLDAEAEFKRAIELNPNYATAHDWYGCYLMTIGRFDEAKAEMKLAQELDPLSITINVRAGWPLFFMRQYDEAIEHFSKAIELDANPWLAYISLGRAYLGKLMYREAIAEIQKAMSLNNIVWVSAILGHAYAVSGQRVEAQKVITRLKELSQKNNDSPFCIAIIYASLGEKDQALKWLEKAQEDRSVLLVWLKIEPALDGLRTDPRFIELLRQFYRRVGLKP